MTWTSAMVVLGFFAFLAVTSVALIRSQAVESRAREAEAKLEMERLRRGG